MRQWILLVLFESIIFSGGAGVSALIPEWSPWAWFTVTGISMVAFIFVAIGIDRRFPWRVRIERTRPASRDDLMDNREVRARSRSRQADANFRTFLYDLNTVIARVLTPKPYQRPPEQDSEAHDEEPRDSS